MLREANNEILVRYLLGELNEPEQESIESHYFSDAGFFEQLLIVEDELIDAYVCGELNSEQRERFEDYFLQSPERREKVEFAEAWQAFIAKQDKWNRQHYSYLQPQSVFKHKSFLLPVAASLLMAMGATWLWFDRRNLKGELDNTKMALKQIEERQQSLEDQAGEQKARNDELLRALEEERARRAGASTNEQASQPPYLASAFFILSSMTRSIDESKPLTIPPRTKQVRLQANFSGGDYTAYSAVLKTLSDVEIHRWSDLKPRIRRNIGTVVLTLPADQLINEDYILTLSGASASGAEETIKEYAFRVVRK